jgi:LAO/AO transport system kinase
MKGAGKSCMIESFGIQLLQNDPDLKLAIVCIDPSSTISGGSILGDKTRMRQLSSFSYSSSSKSSNTNMEGFVDRVFIRPSSNSQSVGGIATYTDDVVKLLSCAAAGYNLVFVETVGLGQSEIEIIQSVDVLVLLIPPGGGDELQGVKKGIVELANIITITKTDSELEPIATRTASDYKVRICNDV